MTAALSGVLLAGACVLAAVIIGPFSVAAARAAMIGLCIIVAAVALLAGYAVGIPVAVVSAAVLERLARSWAVSLPTGTGYAGTFAVAGVVAYGAFRALSSSLCAPGGSSSPSPGSAAALAASVVSVLVVQAVTGRR